VLRHADGLNLSTLRPVPPLIRLSRTSTDSSTTVGIPLSRLPTVLR
jgi:hypothetical protein